MSRVIKKFFLFIFIIGLHTRLVMGSNLFQSEEEITQCPSNSWSVCAEIPDHFVKTLFDPFINEDALKFYTNQKIQIQEKGFLGYIANTVFQTLNSAPSLTIQGVYLVNGWIYLPFPMMIGEDTPPYNTPVFTVGEDTPPYNTRVFNEASFG
jgi:hypothetical protein